MTKRGGGNSRRGRASRREAKERYIADTQMYQRISGKPESSYEELAAKYNSFRNRSPVASDDSGAV